MVDRPKPTFKTTLAVFRPTPGNSINFSKLSGTLLLCFSSMASLTGFAYIFSKITNFIDTHSFSQNASPIRDEAGFSYESNFEMRTGRDDWIFSPSDSQLSLNDLTSEPPSDLAPELHDAWYQSALETMHNSWADLMNNELMFLDIITLLGDLMWPIVPLLIWIFALVEGYYLYKDKKEDPMLILKSYVSKLTSPISQRIASKPSLPKNTKMRQKYAHRK